MDRQKLRSSHSKPRRRSGRSYALIAIGVVIAVPIVACGVFIAQFDPNAYAPQLIAAVQKATGRTLSLGGPLRLQLSLTPTLTASDVSLSNPATFNAPALLTLKQVQARIALLPLLHHRLDILELKLVQPKLYLERNANGQADWTLHPAPSAATNASPTTRKQTGRTAYSLALESVSVEDGEISFRPTGAAQPTIIQLSRFTGKADGLSAPLHVTGAAAIGTTPLTLQGVVGPVAGLTGGDNEPWPVDLTFGYAGASAKMQGQIAHPQRLSGYTLHVTSQIPALEQVGAAIPAAWLHGETLPALHDVAASFTMADQPAGQLKLSDIAVEAGKSDLSHLWPGLQLTALKAALPDISATGTLAITGDVNQLPLAIQSQWTGLAGFLTPASSGADSTHTAFSGTMDASLGTATASLKGEIATPQSLSGAAWALTLNVPDLSVLSPAWGTPLPAWKDITAKTMLTDSGGQGLTHGIALDGLTASMQNARFGGNATLTWGARPYLKLNLAIATANLDALRAAMPAPSTPAHDSSNPASPTVQNPVTAAAPPFGLLRRFDADASVNADQLVYDGTPYSALQTHAVVKNGLLTIAPFNVQMPGGAISAAGSLDTNIEPAAETLKLNAPALALGPLLKMLNLPLSGLAQGMVQVQVNASSRGDTLAAMRGAISGQFGVASVNDEIDGALINQLFGQALRATGVPAGAIDVTGPTFVRCFALRLDAQNGSGRFKALALDSSRLLLVGGGTVNFASQTLGMVLKPQMRVSGNDIVIPVAIDGPFAKPRYGIASQAAIEAAAQGGDELIDHAKQPLFGGNSIIGKVLGALTNHDGKDVCATALPLARMGQPGPAPRAPTALNDTPPASSPAANSGPRSLLKALLNQ